MEDIDIVVEAQVKYTESKDKVAEAVTNLFGTDGELRIDEDRVMFLSSNRSTLQQLKDQFRDRHIRSAARRLLLSGGEGSNQATLMLNKQAATVRIAALCDDPRESPLGPIVLRISSQKIGEVIDWLTKGYDSGSSE